MPLAVQMVQTGHACLEAGIRFQQPDGNPSYLVVLAVPNERKLMEVKEEIACHGVESAIFFEPDNEWGNTAFCTEPIQEDTRKIFKKYPLWQPG